MNKLACNLGSSSKKFVLYSDNTEPLLTIELQHHSQDKYLAKIKNEKIDVSEEEYKNAFDYALKQIQSNLNLTEKDINLIVHRVVHGGEEFKKPIKINPIILDHIKKYNEFAPLHNPPALELIESINKKLPNLDQYAVFDTSFHLSNEKDKFLYGIPYGYYENIGVRRFGFHGISYDYVCSILDKEVENIKLEQTTGIICHLGSGSSICAVKSGESFNHSFGFTPTENLIMSTRSGEVDYDAVAYIKKKLGLSDKEVETLLNKESGLLAISGYTSDMKTLVDDYEKKPRAKLAVDMYCTEVLDFISQFYVQLHGCDYLVFTGTIGRDSYFIRKLITRNLEILGIKVNNDKNEKTIGKQLENISHVNSIVEVFVIETDESLQMAKLVEKIE